MMGSFMSKLSLMGLLLLFSFICEAKPLVVEGDVEFVAIGRPDFITIDGVDGKLVDSKLVYDAGKITGEISVDLTKMTTDMDLRDEHMKERYLVTAKYPKARLSKIVAVGGKFTGQLTIKDETKPVSGKFKLTDKKLSAEFKIQLKDFKNVGVPSHAGITVANEVEIKVNGTVK